VWRGSVGKRTGDDIGNFYPIGICARCYGAAGEAETDIWLSAYNHAVTAGQEVPSGRLAKGGSGPRRH
jgi:hypothetical protein